MNWTLLAGLALVVVAVLMRGAVKRAQLRKMKDAAKAARQDAAVAAHEAAEATHEAAEVEAEAEAASVEIESAEDDELADMINEVF